MYVVVTPVTVTAVTSTRVKGHTGVSLRNVGNSILAAPAVISSFYPLSGKMLRADVEQVISIWKEGSVTYYSFLNSGSFFLKVKSCVPKFPG